MIIPKYLQSHKALIWKLIRSEGSLAWDYYCFVVIYRRFLQRLKW